MQQARLAKALNVQELLDMTAALVNSSPLVRDDLLKQIKKVNPDECFRISKQMDYELIRRSNYAYSTLGTGRDHGKYAVEATMGMKEELRAMKGDALKTKILSDFKESIAQIREPDVLK